MISVFTPSHDPKYLSGAFFSLMGQTYTEPFEWVVLLNNGAEWKPPVEASWVRVITSVEPDKGIGFYKREAVSYCRGEILVELDHDDKLHPEALESVAEAFDQADDIVFVYSDFAQMTEDGSPDDTKFDLSYGWAYYEVEGGYEACRSFPPYPHNLGYIWYAPNHLRAFTKKAYEQVGGYSQEHFVLDDQDIMSRLFEIGEFHYIRDCLYYQRVHTGQTQSQQDRNAEIQTGTVDMYDLSIERMARAWAKRRGLKCLDLGSAHNKPAGYLGVDLHEGEGVDYVGNFMDLYLEPGSVGVIRAVDFLEHVEDKVAVMNRIWELLAHGGMLLSLTPSTDGRGAFQDPTHISYWNENSFWYYTDEKYQKYVPAIKCDFQVSRLATIYPSGWHYTNQIPYVLANLVANKKGFRDFGGRVTN